MFVCSLFRSSSLCGLSLFLRLSLKLTLVESTLSLSKYSWSRFYGVSSFLSVSTYLGLRSSSTIVTSNSTKRWGKFLPKVYWLSYNTHPHVNRTSTTWSNKLRLRTFLRINFLFPKSFLEMPKYIRILFMPSSAG